MRVKVLIKHDERHPITQISITEESVISVLLKEFESELYWNGNEANILIRGWKKNVR